MKLYEQLSLDIKEKIKLGHYDNNQKLPLIKWTRPRPQLKNKNQPKPTMYKEPAIS